MITSLSVDEQIGAYARSKLDDTDLDLLRLIAAGCASRQIGERLGLARTNLCVRVARVLRVLGAHNRSHAVAIAYATGLLKGMP